MAGKKNLIMGIWSRLPFEGLERFLASLRRTTFEGDVCVFVDDVSDLTIRSLHAHGVIVERANRFALPQMNYLGSRHYSYLEFLARHGHEYAFVMISDLRDVIFQVDPFATPLPAELVFAQERIRVGDCPVNRSWLVQLYGEATADNMKHCMVSCAGTTFGTVQGVRQYCTTMVHEMAQRTIPLTGGLEQAVHNFVIRMRPLRNAWCDPADSLVATMAYTPDEAVAIDPRGVLIDGRVVPVIHQWDRKATLNAFVESAPQFKLDVAVAPHYPIIRRSEPGPVEFTATSGFDAVVCFYHRPRDADWLAIFLATLRAVGFTGDIHCIGVLDAGELAVLARYGALGYAVGPWNPEFDADNVAHWHLSRVLDIIAASPTAHPDQVLAIDTMRVGFLRDPFLNKTIGLSAFCEGPTSIGESSYNSHRLGQFVTVDESWERRPIVSSAMLRGGLEEVRAFYQKLFGEFAGRPELMSVQKVVQGAFNKICQDGSLGIPVILHPNAAEVYFELWPQSLTFDYRFGVRVGGAVPAMVVNPFHETPLMSMLKGNLHLDSVRAP